MSTRTAAARRPHAGRPAARPVAPHGPRRVSGPARPAPRPAARPAVTASPAAAAALGRLRALPDARALDRLLRSRACIWVVAVALLGLVAVQVSLLKLNTGISRAVQASATLERQNATLETQIARLSATEKIRTVAAARGMVAPLAGEVSYLTARGGFDGVRAAKIMRPPSDKAQALMAAGGIVTPPAPVAPVDPAAAPVDPTAVPAVTTTDPASTAADPAAVAATTAFAPVPTPAPATTDAVAPTG
jgi:hypothetical protein